MLPALVFLALVAFAAALLWAPHAGRAAVLHLILAVGAMPLIFGAMSHFIPVLTRTRAAADCSASPFWRWPAARWWWARSVCPACIGGVIRARCWR